VKRTFVPFGPWLLHLPSTDVKVTCGVYLYPFTRFLWSRAPKPGPTAADFVGADDVVSDGAELAREVIAYFTDGTTPEDEVQGGLVLPNPDHCPGPRRKGAEALSRFRAPGVEPRLP
jgi:hypothetical protein